MSDNGTLHKACAGTNEICVIEGKPRQMTLFLILNEIISAANKADNLP